MKKIGIFITFAFVVILPLTTKAFTPEAVIFENVSAIDLDEGSPGEPVNVLVRGDRIIEISTRPFSDAAVVRIDGTGKFLLPGLAEMHGHIVDTSEYTQDVKDLLFLYLSNGVTTVRGMLGNAGQLKLQQDIVEGEILGPTLYLGSPSFNGNTVTSPEQARQKVKDHVAEGWDFLKIHPGLTLDEYNAMADEAKKAGFKWGGHIPAEVGLFNAVEAGQRTIDHLDGFLEFAKAIEGNEVKPIDEELLDEAINLVLKANVTIVPTNTLYENLFGEVPVEELLARQEMAYVRPEALANWEATANQTKPKQDGLESSRNFIKNRQKVIKALYEAGVPVLLGSDAPQLFSVPGFSIPREMESMAAAGMDNLGILRSGTIMVGKFFSHRDAFGRIAPGMRADAILLNSNPLEDISNIRDLAGVMARGRWLSREEIDTRLKEIAERKKSNEPAKGAIQ